MRWIAIAAGGPCPDHTHSLATGQAAAAALVQAGFGVVELTLEPDGVWSRCGTPLAAGSAASHRVALLLKGACNAVVSTLATVSEATSVLAQKCHQAGIPLVSCDSASHAVLATSVEVR